VGLHHEYRSRPDSPWVFGFAVGTSAATRAMRILLSTACLAVTCGLWAYTKLGLTVRTHARHLLACRHLLCLPMNFDARNAARSSSVRSTTTEHEKSHPSCPNCKSEASNPCSLISTP
jgi:hypothetical protein